jgi:hypothetical protein
MVTGTLYLVAASGLARCPRPIVGSRVVTVLVAGVGAGLIGSGVFVTDPVGGLAMVASFLLFGAAFGGAPRLAAKGGIFQRISIVSGFGWLSALSLRARTSFRRN